MAPKRLLAHLLTGILLAASTASYAQGGPPGGRPGGGHGAGGPGHPGMDHPGMDRPGPGPRHDMGRGPGRAPGHDHRGPQGRGPGGPGDPAYRHWAKGERVPFPYRGPQYVVDNWRGHRLAPPPRGYHWINVGADYFLIGVATGVVLQAILNP